MLSTDCTGFLLNYLGIRIKMLQKLPHKNHKMLSNLIILKKAQFNLNGLINKHNYHF